MTYHIFNPEHDIALASNLTNFTAPHAGRQLRHDLGFLPVLWASEGDGILADDAELARKSIGKLSARLPHASRARLHAFQDSVYTINQAARKDSLSFIEPWGWDAALKSLLLRHGISPSSLPTDETLSTIRQLSHRQLAASLLPQLRVDGTVGQSFFCTDMASVSSLLQSHGRLVLKAPWSSSGRGLRFLHATQAPASSQEGWIKNVVAAQGAVMAEPYYNKVKDFGMEFCTDGAGHTTYLGLSLFHTMNGAYTGNVLATENWKQNQLSAFLPAELTHFVESAICEQTARLFRDKYKGPFGVDMMVVARDDADGFLLHPCVEINLRRTMGHAALSLTHLFNPTSDDDVTGVMRIKYEDNNYKLILQKL